MQALRAEFIKLKRSLSWTVVFLLPLVMVLSGAVNTLMADEQPDDGWHTMWLRSAVFYGLFPLAVGIGILASLVWRSEHQGGNWNALMSGPTSTWRIVAAKAGSLSLLTAGMQILLLSSVAAVGKLVFGLPGMPPPDYLGITALIAVACLPVAVLQSGLSMIFRSFAVPIAVAFTGAGLAVVLLLAELPGLVWVFPYALIGRTTQLGTGTFADSGHISAVDVLTVLGASGLLTVVLLFGSVAWLERKDF